MAEKNIDKNEILSKEIDKDELETVSGGTAGGPGGCTGSYFREKCSATVEQGSWCGSNDWCTVFSEHYICNVYNNHEWDSGN
ncbi:MAG: hypothetical protein GX685_08615 [Clostridiales bacterium]|jgi:hypothetical protein|nr:hypothetical protein [Clostridiales bacterium]